MHTLLRLSKRGRAHRDLQKNRVQELKLKRQYDIHASFPVHKHGICSWPPKMVVRSPYGLVPRRFSPWNSSIRFLPSLTTLSHVFCNCNCVFLRLPQIYGSARRFVTIYKEKYTVWWWISRIMVNNFTLFCH